jgi:hypothetical protein
MVGDLRYLDIESIPIEPNTYNIGLLPRPMTSKDEGYSNGSDMKRQALGSNSKRHADRLEEMARTLQEY